MSIEVAATGIDVEQILHDVMYIVVSYLELQDLSNVSEVCISWREEALREKAKRFYIQKLNLPYKFSNRDSKISFTPCASLIFYKRHKRIFFGRDSTYSQLLAEDVAAEKLLKDSIKQLPQRTVAIGVDTYLSVDGKELKQASNCNVFNFFFPCVRIVCASPIYDVNDVVERLGANDCGYPKSTFILSFVSGGESITQSLIERIKLLPNAEFMVYMSPKILSNNEADQTEMVALRIADPNVESWTTIIHNKTSIDEIKLKLQELKGRVKPRRYYTGLFHGFRCYESSCNHIDHPAHDEKNIVHLLKCFFPGVSLVGTFDYPNVAVETWPEGLGTRLLRDISIMIISHD